MDLPLVVGAGVGALVALTASYFIIQALSKSQGKMGINLQTTLCPECREPAPRVRRPRNWQQFLWGGWTCAKCGCESDKWGKRVPR